MEKLDKMIVEHPVLSNGGDIEDTRFAIPIKMGEWWFVATTPCLDSVKFQNKLTRFIYCIEHHCKAYGLGDQRIKQLSCDRIERSELEDIFTEAKMTGVQYIIVGSEQTVTIDKPFHSFVKSMEQKYSIATCHVIYDSISDDEFPLDSKDLVINLIKKANMKLGGLNYYIKDGHEQFCAVDDLIIGVNVNYYDLPLHKLHEAESRMDRSVMIVGFSANDLAEPNVFTGDYLYGLRDPKAMLGSLKNILFDCVRRYRSNRDKLPQSVTIMLTVRDCHEKFKIFYHELAELCMFVENEFGFAGPVHMITFNKLEKSVGNDDDEKPKPGTVLNTFITRYDAIAFDLVTHWAPVRNGHGKYEVRAGHYEVYTSLRCDPSFKKRPLKSEHSHEQRVSWEGVTKSSWTQNNQSKVPVNCVDSEKPKPNWASKPNWANKVDEASNAKSGWGEKINKEGGPIGSGWKSAKLGWDHKQEDTFSSAKRFEERDFVFPGDDPLYSTGVRGMQSDIRYWPQLMHTLGHCHQLVSYPTSLPGPVRIPNNLSRRGYSMLQCNLKVEDLKGNSSEILDRFNAWTYSKTTLRNQRFSA